MSGRERNEKMITITIEFTAQLKQAANIASEEISVATNSTARDAILQVATLHGEALQRILLSETETISSALLIFIGDEQVVDLKSFTLSEGDRMTLMSPISGG